MHCLCQTWNVLLLPPLLRCLCLQPQLKTSLQNSEVVIAPPVKEVSKLLSAYIKNVAESAREFVRWMDGTCLEMPDQRAKGDTDGDPVVMHFSSEVLRMQQVKFRSDLSLL
jgi:dynein heavy chain